MTRMLKQAFERASTLTEMQQDTIAQVVLAELEKVGSRPADRFVEVHQNAPQDDEPMTKEDLAALREGLDDLASGRTLTREEIQRILA